jgi:hypothetical protein
MPMSIWWNRQFFCSLMYQLWNMTPNAVSFLTRSEPEICGSNWHQTWIVGNTQSCPALYWHGFGIKIHQIYIIQLSVLVFSNLDKQTFDNRQDVMMTIKQYQKYTYPHLPFICLAHLRKKNICTSWRLHRVFRSWSGSESAPPAAVQGASPRPSSGLWGFPPTPAGGKSATEALRKSAKIWGVSHQTLGSWFKELGNQSTPSSDNHVLVTPLDLNNKNGDITTKTFGESWSCCSCFNLPVKRAETPNIFHGNKRHVPHYFTCLSVTDFCHSCQVLKTNTTLLFPNSIPILTT